MLLAFMNFASLVLVVTVTVVTGPAVVFGGPESLVLTMAGDPTADRVAVARSADVAETVKTALSVSGPTGIDRVVIKTCALDWKTPEQYWLPVIESNEPL